jgi:hypothetical protein
VVKHIGQTLGKARLQQEAHQLHRQLQGVMRTFGRTCRGQQRVYVSLVRQTEKQLLTVGQLVGPMALKAMLDLYEDRTLSDRQNARLQQCLQQAAQHYECIERQSRRLTQGKKLDHAKIVNAYDRTIAPILKGKSNCPAQFGKKPGLVAEMATGFIFGLHLPQGNPEDGSYMMPLLGQVQQAIQPMARRRKPRIQSVAADLAFRPAALRNPLHERGCLTVGIPHTLEPVPQTPTPRMIADAQQSLPRPHRPSATQVKIAYACGYSRPFVESLIESLSVRGGTQLKYKGHRGAFIQTMTAVLAHNAATLDRIQQNQLTQRAQRFRRFFRLKSPNSLQHNDEKNK